MLFGKACQQPAHSTEALSTKAVQLPDTCTQATTAARRDFAAAHYELHSQETLPVENAYHDVLRLDYQIQWRFVGEYAPGSYWYCYDSVLWPMLERKYGLGFAARVRHKADSLDRTGHWNAYADFPGGTEAMFRFFQQNINWKRIKPTAKRVAVSFTIQTDGHISDVTIMKEVGEPYDTEALRLVKRMPQWQPSYRAGKAQPMRYTVAVRFDHVSTNSPSTDRQ